MINETENIKGILVEYGRFFLQFEHICNKLRENMRYLIPVHGQYAEEYCAILFADLGAAELNKKHYALLKVTHYDKQEQLALAKKWRDKFDKLCSFRNSLAHGTMQPGRIKWEEGTYDYNTFFLNHLKLGNNSYGFSEMLSVASLQSLNENTLKLYQSLDEELAVFSNWNENNYQQEAKNRYEQSVNAANFEWKKVTFDDAEN